MDLTTQLPAPRLVPVGELRPWDENPRSITSERLENLRRALAADPEFLRLRPILARSDGLIYCGNQRYRAAVANGATAVPAVLEDVDERTMRERAIRDNEQWGEWSDGLALVLRSLEGAGSDLSVLGLGDDHVERLLAAALQSEASEPDDLDLVPTEIATTQPGQLYELGPHRLICGDARDGEVWTRLLGDERADCLWTDPPYGVDLHVGGHSGDFAERLRERRKGPPAFRGDRESELAPLLGAAFPHADRYLRPGAPLYIAAPHSPEQFAVFIAAAKAVGWHLSQTLVWVKNTFVPALQDYHYQHEAVLYGWKPGAAHTWLMANDESTVIDDEPNVAKMDRAALLAYAKELRARLRTDVLREPKPQVNDLHPTMKPVPLVTRMLANSTWRGDLVLDPFGGSGSTLIACEQLGRRAALIELEPRFVDVIVRRYEAMTAAAERAA
ncbi:MAG: ParB N-terminal domain-containing protein [Actinobacteria bacterium]|nr:ParB N-terminal domain-containing protein [Actinomycetota bacterium]